MDKEFTKKVEEKDEIDELGFQPVFSLSTLRHEQELFKDEDNIKYKSVNVKRVNLPRRGEDWEVLEDGKPVLTLKGTRFSNKEKKFLRTVEGMSFIINGWKYGWKSVLKFKNELQRLI